MWNNLVFWRIAALITVATFAAMLVFFRQRVKKIQNEYNKSFDKAQKEVDRIQEKSDRFSGQLQESISTLVTLLLTLYEWAKTKNKDRELEFQVTLEKLPEEIRKLLGDIKF